MRISIGCRAAVLALILMGACSQVSATEDDLIWLESPHDAKALAWTREATNRTRQRLGALPSEKTIAAELTTVLAQAPAEPDQFLLGARAVRFLRDAANPYGLLQTTPRNAKGVARVWRTVLDVAELRKREGTALELQAYSLGNSCLAPAYTRCLLRLSPGGGDDVEIREFDLNKGVFVADGFKMDKSRAFAEWLGPDKLLVAHTLEGAPKTLAGWPASIRIWSRGTPLAQAKSVYEGQASDAVLQISTVGSGAQALGVITRAIDFSNFEVLLVNPNGKPELLPFPRSINSLGVLGASSRHVIAQLSQDVTMEGKLFKAETVVAYDASPSAHEGHRVSAVYSPVDDEFVDAAFGGLATTRDDVLLIVNTNLRQRIIGSHFSNGQWTKREVFKACAGETLTVRSDERDRNEFIASISGFVTPRSQYLFREAGSRYLLAKDPVILDASGFTTEIGSAFSKDGTSVDYFLVKPLKAASGPGPMPLLMTGYGAFGISVRPGYFDGSVGGPAMKLWLERGGSVAIPAIRGGGERGAAWHTAAIREKRQNSYDDFIAVAEQLVSTGFTSPDRIGIFGMSNGGLLTATLGIQRPDLFGAVVSDVPLTDLMRMRHMGMGAAWTNEYGDPDEPAQAKAILAYSPYQNVRDDTSYPPFLITISTEDNRVGPGHARKLAYKLDRAGATTYFYEDEEGGHDVSDAFRNPELMGLRMSFLIDTLMNK